MNFQEAFSPGLHSGLSTWLLRKLGRRSFYNPRCTHTSSRVPKNVFNEMFLLVKGACTAAPSINLNEFPEWVEAEHVEALEILPQMRIPTKFQASDLNLVDRFIRKAWEDKPFFISETGAGGCSRQVGVQGFRVLGNSERWFVGWGSVLTVNISRVAGR